MNIKSLMERGGLDTGSSRAVSVGARGKFLRFESHASFTNT